MGCITTKPQSITDKKEDSNDKNGSTPNSIVLAEIETQHALNTPSTELKEKDIKNPDSISSLIHKLKILFDGYIRQEILSQSTLSMIAMDVIDVCYEYYHVDINSMINKECRPPPWTNRFDVARKIWKTADEYYICYELYKLALNNEELDHYKEFRSHFTIARILFRWREFEESDKAFQNALAVLTTYGFFIGSLDRLKIDCHFRYGKMLQTWGQYKGYKAAIEQFQLAFEVKKDDAKHMYHTALCYEKLEDFDGADGAYQEAMKMCPNKTSYIYEYARFLYDNVKIAEALEALIKAGKLSRTPAKKDRESAIRIYQGIMERVPQNVDVKYWYARLLRKCGRNEEAKKYFKMVIDSNPDECGGETMYQYARVCGELGDKEEAAQYLTEALKTGSGLDFDDDNTGKYLNDCGRVLGGYNDWKGAIIPLTKAVELNPTKASFASDVAICYEELGEYENADKYYKLAVDVGSKNGATYFSNYASFLEKRKDIASAKEYLLKGMDMYPDNADLCFLYARLLRNSGDYGESKEYYLKCIKLDSTHNSVHGSYGYLLYLTGKYEEALEQIQIGLEMNEKSKWGQYYRGLVCAKIGNDELAEESLLKTIDLIKTKKQGDRMMKRINSTEMEYHQRFKSMLEEKFK